MDIKKLIFNPLQENTYIVYDDTKECVIIDPGCQKPEEKNVLKQFISGAGLRPKVLLNTHCHFDHIFGNNFVCSEYGIELWASEGELANIRRFVASASLFGISEEQPGPPALFLEDGQTVKFGNSELKVIATPGHSPGSLCFYSEAEMFLIAGDTLFAGSIGRTDLPGGSYDEIRKSLEKLIALPAETCVYCGHGSDTTIGREQLYNPFIAEI
ncbi:MAG: MBL fold metallo-hydrolase [Prevotellaceae bacterium]|jgi:glyoxylase-like metal-dependent hydrolase (beta-lactamase superfamily II)|nr:MBL fold metallo-hydrolase [Prevotellaceae bacterium]